MSDTRQTRSKESRAGRAAVRQSPGPRATLKAVATAAGVSVSTASLVFSGHGPVSHATRERVRAAAEVLGYRGPDPRAASLRRGRSGVVACVVEGRLLHAFRDPYAVSVLDGLAAELDAEDLGLLLISQPLEAPERAVDRLAGTAFDALVFLGCGPLANPLVRPVRERGIPIVALGSPVGEGIVVVDVDNRAGMAGAAAYLRDLGHERVATVVLPLATGRQPTGVCTVAGLLAGQLPDAGLPAAPPDTLGRLVGTQAVYGPDCPAVVAPDADIDGGAAAAAALLDLPPGRRPTAILAQSDLLAAGVARAAAERGLRVPEDLSVTGFDGIPMPWWPGVLTTVEQPGAEKGAAAGRAVRALLAGEPAVTQTLPTRLRIGTSTARPPTPAS